MNLRRKTLSIFLIIILAGVSMASLANASGSTYPQSYSGTAYENTTLNYYYLATSTTNTNFQASTPTNSTTDYINQDSTTGVWTIDGSSSFGVGASYATYAFPSGQQYISGSIFNSYAEWAFIPSEDGNNLPYAGIVGVYLVNGGNLGNDALSMINTMYTREDQTSSGAEYVPQSAMNNVGGNSIASWSHLFNTQETSATTNPWVYVNPTFSIPSGTVQPITGIIFINIGSNNTIDTAGNGLIDFADANANNNVINQGQPSYQANYIGYTGYTTPTTDSSWTIPSDTQSYTISWSTSYPVVLTYNGNTYSGTSGSFAGSTGNAAISGYWEYWVSGTQSIDTTETFSVATSDQTTLTATTSYTINQQTSNITYYESSFTFSFTTPSNAITGNSNFEMSWSTSIAHLEDIFYSSSGGDSWSATITPGSNSAPSGTTYRTVTNTYTTTSGGSLTWTVSTTEIVNPDISTSITSSLSTTDVGVNVTYYPHPTQRIPPYQYTYEWTINGNTYTTENATVSYPASGDYVVELAVTDNEGFVGTATYDQVVNSDPVVSASVNVSSADINYPIEFSSSPSGGTSPYNYTWTLNGVIQSYSQDFSESFSSAGSYTMVITLTDSLGVKASDSITVKINSNPSVVIASNKNPADVGQSVGFTSTETGGTGTILYSWTVDGTVESTIQSLTYTFSSTGSYYVNLTVTDSESHTYTATFTQIVNTDPSAVIIATPSPTEINVATNISADVSGGTAPYSYSWSINDTQISTSPYFIYTFKGVADYTIGLALTDSAGDIYTTTTNEQVDPPPSVKISVNNNPIDANTTFNVTSTVSGGLSPYSYSWMIGTKQVSILPYYNGSLPESGSYTINLTVTDSHGVTATASLVLQVHGYPVSSISPSILPIDANVKETFIPTVVNGTGPYSYQWLALGKISTSEDLSVTFSTAGTYNITLIVSDKFGKDGTSYYNLKVNSDPVISIKNSTHPVASKPTVFNLTLTGGIAPYTVQWFFPGGEQFSGLNVSFVFSESGPETYQVKVSDSGGYSSTFNETIQINLYVVISSNITSGFAPISVVFFSDVVGGSSYIYNWTYNNIEFSVTSNPTFSFPEGNYTITLTIISANGATGFATEKIESLPPPVIASVIPVNGTVLTTFNFKAIPNWDASGPYNATWTLPNGNVLSGLNVSYRFTTYTATETVNLQFFYDSGKTYNIPVTIRLTPAPITISFNAPQNIGVGSMLNVSALVTDPDSTAISYTWIFDSQIYSGQNQLFYFQNIGNYSISLTVTDSLGVSATMVKYVQVEQIGTSKNINIGIASVTSGPYVTYTVNVTSNYNITSVEGFFGTTYISMTPIKNGSGYWVYNLTLNQGSYYVGDYTITFVAFASNGQSNQKNADFYVTSSYGKSSSSFSIVSFFGGITNFMITILGIISSVSVVLYVRSDKKDRNTEYININGMQIKAKKSRSASKAFQKASKHQNDVTLNGTNKGGGKS